MAIAQSQHLPIAAAACSAGSGLWEWTATVIGNIQTNTSMNSPWWHQMHCVMQEGWPNAVISNQETHE